MPKMTRRMIEDNVIEVMEKVKFSRNQTDRIIDKMSEYDYLAGDIQGYISNTENEISKMDIRTICILLLCVYEVTGISQSQPLLYFTESEIQTSKQFTGDLLRNDRIELPLTIHNVFEVGNGIYSTVFSVQMIKRLMDSLLLHYNFESQREAKELTIDNQIIYEPTVYPQNIKEMTEHLKNGTLIPNTIIINAGVRTSESGTELLFNKERHELVVMKGSKLDIVDGYHRCRAIQNALSLDPNIEFNFPIILTNFTVKKAQKFLGQMAKGAPISEARKQELSAERYSDDVVQMLKEESELRGRITQSGSRIYDNKRLVSYDILSDGIEENFKMSNKADAMDVGDYLCDYFNYLISTNEEYFINNVTETRGKSLINQDFMIGYGFITLANRMQKEGIRVRKIRNILSTIDFSLDNPEWKKLKLINKNDEIVELDKAKKIITKFFKEIELKEGVLSE